MSAVRQAVLSAAVLAFLPATASGADAPARSDVLVAQLAQTSPTPEPLREPVLTEDPPTPLGGGPNGDGDGDGNGDDGAEEASPGNGGLADTGSEAGLLALAGASLAGLGLSLRLRLRDAA